MLDAHKKYVRLGDQIKREYPEALVVTIPREGYVMFKYRQRRATGNIHVWDERVRNTEEWSRLKEEISQQAEGVDDA